MKRVIGFLLLFTLFVSAGTIYATGNSAQNLSNWYKVSFLKESEKAGAVTTSGIIGALKEVNVFLNESKKSIDDTLASYRDDKISETEAGIEEYQANTIKSLNNTIAGLEKENFVDYVDKLNIEKEIEQEFEQMVEEVFNE